MKTLYLDCQMGAAGDMLAAALFELVEDKTLIINKLNDMGIPGVSFIANSAIKSGIKGTHMEVSINGEKEESLDCDKEQDHIHHHEHEDSHEHHHNNEVGHHTHIHHSLADIDEIIDSLKLVSELKTQAKEIYRIIANAESSVHGMPVTDIHFHEVGSLDAIADVTAVCLIMNELKPDSVIASPIHLGSGQVKCAHGILPIPAPATANILKGIPCYSSDIKGELCTPTGAALLKYFVKEFGAMPVMSVEKIGYGAGKKEFERANILRAMLGDSNDKKKEDVVELICNIDDMTGEELGFATDVLLNAGALDVYTTPIYMKKNRPGVKLSILVKSDQVDEFIPIIFKNTSTIGVREAYYKRYTLDRCEKTINTKLGQLRVKESSGYGVKKQKPEYEDIVKIAKDNAISYQEVIKGLR